MAIGKKTSFDAGLGWIFRLSALESLSAKQLMKNIFHLW
jgi:hypothetical protein